MTRMAAPVFALLLVSASLALAKAPGEWRIESTDARGLVLLWENASLGTDGEGAARSAAIGVPPGARPSGSLEILEERGGRPRVGIRALQGSGAGPFTVSAPARFRDLEVAALTLNPLRDGKVVTRARVRVEFGTGSSKGSTSSIRSPSTDRLSSPVRAAFAQAADGAPERYLSDWILNYSQSRGFRSHEVKPLGKTAAGPSPGPAGSGEGPTAGASLPEVRLLIKTAGENIEVLDYAALKKAGVPVDRIDPRYMRLHRDGIEVPMFIAGGNDGRWNAGDHIEFVGKAPSGDRTYHSLYVSTSTFILTWGGGKLGLRAPAVPVSSRAMGTVPGSLGGVKDAPPFKVSVHMELDKEILRIGSTAVEEVVDLGARVQSTELSDFWMWVRQGAEIDALEVPFTLDFDPVPQGDGAAPKVVPLRVKVNMKGITNNPKADPDHHVKFILNGSDISLVDGIAQDAIWEGQESYTWTSRPLNPSLLKAGKNTLVIQKVNDLRSNDGTPVEVQDAFLNWFELEFPSSYATQIDIVRFSNAFEDSLGVRNFKLQGFTTGNLSIWDLQGRKLTGYGVNGNGGKYDIALVDSLAGPTRYIACAMDRREVPGIELDTLDNLVSPAEGADYIVITQKELLGSALDSLVDHRRKQGMRVRTVLASHIYQAFGDGSMDPAAIRRFVSHAYRNWARPAPAYLLLLGETSLWYEKLSGDFQKTIVPTQLVNIQGWGVAAHDDYFVKVSGEDDVADLFVGRIPVANRGDLSRVVRKTLALENRRPMGHWANKALLVAGFEESFTVLNGRLQSLAVSHDRNYSRVDLYPKSPHYRSASQRTNFFDQLDSGFTLVNFVGHGGGAVWSDAGVLTLRQLDDGKLKGEYPIPLVSSITCLTGYFEDHSARSLGEEMIRLDKGGAAAFYGAAGYISNLAGEALAYEILNASAGRAGTTSGSVIHQAETMTNLITGGVFAPILSEFNLLGDPALRLSYPTAEGELNLSPRTLNAAASVDIKGAKLIPENAEGVLTLYLGDSTLGATPVSIAGGSFDSKRSLAGLAGPVPDGKAVVHYWNEKESRIVSAPFTTLDWLIDSVRIDPAMAAPGDSVAIRLRLGTAYENIAVDGGIAFYAVGGEKPPLFPGENQMALGKPSGSLLESSVKLVIPVPAVEFPHAKLHLAFRLSLRVLNGAGETISTLPVSSRIYSLPLSNLGRLSFVEPAMRIPVQDILGVWAVFRNSGLGKASGFSVILTRDAESSSPTEDTLTYSRDLDLGGIDSLFFALPDDQVDSKRVRVSLKPARDGELADRGTVRDTVFQVLTRTLASPSDSLRLDTATTITLPSGGKARRVFAERASIAALPSHLSPGTGSLPAEAWRIQSPAMQTGSLILAKAIPGNPALIKAGNSEAGPAAPASHGALAASAPDRPFWHYQSPGPNPGNGRVWLKLDTADLGAAPGAARTFADGLYASLLNKDLSPPLIQFSSRGQALLQDDYVPQNTPIDVVVRDAEGVDMALRPPSLSSRQQTMDSSTLAVEGSSLSPTLVRFNFLPKHGASQDSLQVVATDVSGNRTTKVLAYRHGDDLSIRNLGSYPNPFADTAVFVYTVTDYCEKVQLKIYSRAGRLVRSLEQRNVVGYQEILWDGRSQSGGNIGNGLYFLKVTARAGDQESSQVFKLFKKRRK